MTGYETVLREVDVAGRTWALETLKDRSQFFDPDGAHEAAGVAPASWPLFGVIWPAGLVLAEYAATCPIDGIRILEVGCGLGLASMVIAARGGNITASDVHPLAGEFLTRNAGRNRVAPPAFRIVDWRRQDDTAPYDVIIGSDLLYERGQPERLAAFLARHCAAAGQVVITDPGRGQIARFNQRMSAAGFSVNEDRRGKARLVRYSRSTLSHQGARSTT